MTKLLEMSLDPGYPDVTLGGWKRSKCERHFNPIDGDTNDCFATLNDAPESVKDSIAKALKENKPVNSRLCLQGPFKIESLRPNWDAAKSVFLGNGPKIFVLPSSIQLEFLSEDKSSVLWTAK